MRIGVLTTGYPRFAGDVAGSFVAGMTDALQDRGHLVDVLAPEPKSPMHIQGRVRSVSVQWVPYVRPRALQTTFFGAGAPDNLKDPRAWLGALTFPLALRRRAARHEWDALISHFGIPCGLVGESLGIRRRVVVWHSADVTLASKMPRVLRQRLFGRSRHWFVSERHRRTLAIEAPSVVQPMGASVRHHDRPRCRAALNIEGPTILFVGRLVPVKGVDVLIEAVAGTGWSLVIAGEGPERRRLESLAKACDVAAQFTGRVAPTERDRLMAACDVLAVPSRVLPSGRTEGAPAIVSEAQLIGIPIVASSVGGVPEMVQSRWLVPPESPRALRAALARSLESNRVGPELAWEPAGRTSNTWPAIASRMESLLK